MTEKEIKRLDTLINRAFKHDKNVYSRFYRDTGEDARTAYHSIDKYSKTNTIYYNLTHLLQEPDERVVRIIIHENVHEVFADIEKIMVGCDVYDIFCQFNEAAIEQMVNILYPHIMEMIQ